MEKEQNIKPSQTVWHCVFASNDGKAVLAELLNRLGYFNSVPSNSMMPSPELLAVAQWILAQMGIAVVQNIGNLMDALVDCPYFKADVGPEGSEKE
jgi:hypothetical protein